MSFIDLSVASPSAVIQADFCIVGAGAAGIFLASRLLEKGKSVVLLEAGPVNAIDTESIGFEPSFVKDEYAGALVGRYFGSGGSTSHWGGNLVPHTGYDFRDDCYADVWKNVVNCVEEHSSRVLNNLGYTKEALFHNYAIEALGSAAESLMKVGIHPQSSLLLPFSSKNLAGLLPKISGPRSKLIVINNAVAKDWSFCASETRLVKRLVSVSVKNNKALVEAKNYIIAAGAIESARILLEIDQSTLGSILPKDAAVGAFLGDHLSIAIADVFINDSEKAAKLFGSRFDGSWMRGIRLLEKDTGSDSVRAFAHFEFDNQSPGFMVAKEVLQAIQSRKLPNISVRTIVAGLGDLVALAYYRYFNSRLYIPKNTKSHLQLDIEQNPSCENNITLSAETDAYGRQKILINWEIAERDMENISKTARRFLNLWPKESLEVPALIPREIDPTSRKPYDAYHPVGTCQMGMHKEAVVDFDLKVHGVDNLWVLSTGVLPSAGTANPTFSMLCLGNRLAEQLD